MTRRGSLIYYLTAWICGCFFISFAIWIHQIVEQRLHHDVIRGWTTAFLFFYFYGLMFGAPTLLFGAFVLRRIMNRLRCKTASHWSAVGAILGPLMAVALGRLEPYLNAQRNSILQELALIAAPGKVVLAAGWWIAVPAGAATAYLLSRVDRAFGSEVHASLPTSA
jgi:hypothetical protein